MSTAAARRFGVITLFPEMVQSVREYGVIGRAFREGLAELHCWDPRAFTSDRHRTVDDRPYGGGPGMVMKPEPVVAAIRAARGKLPAARVVYLSPGGRKLDQRGVMELAGHQELILLAGRYEGIDQRALDLEVDEEWSIGDYVLSGGELPVMVILDAVLRQLPGVLGHGESAANDSFAEGLLEYPHFTRPEQFEGREVPAVLRNGNHAEIEAWRREQATARTRQRRPDLLTDGQWRDADAKDDRKS